ncbi:dienelactone hydrolase family protein [Aquimarina sp. Aq78]|uniref:carboxylesterase family protein n=1 Tax=Aquimarina sp. Aq78 TaxID=1191889 RepID=UPI000D10AF53|nr:dienelactone hydrolase family protein [Aquimarina sp. Aq78]
MVYSIIKKKIYLFLLTIQLLANCSSSDSVIDTNANDLVELSTIQSGVQKAYPKGSTKSQYGFYAYVPSEYNIANTEKYPLLIHLHGGGARGDSSVNPNDLNSILFDGPPSLIHKNQWNPKHPMIVVSPQSPSIWNTETLHNFITFLVDNLKIDTQRIYMTGFSMGGKGCYDYVSSKGNKSYVAAIVPIAGWGDVSIGNQFTNIPVWGFHGDADRIISHDKSILMVNAINAENPTTKAKITIYSGVGHDSWSRTYDNTGKGSGNSAYDPFDISIYEWMYLYKKTDL